MKALLEKLREALGQIEVLKTYYARLTDRERYIVLGVGSFWHFICHGPHLLCNAGFCLTSRG